MVVIVARCLLFGGQEVIISLIKVRYFKVF